MNLRAAAAASLLLLGCGEGAATGSSESAIEAGAAAGSDDDVANGGARDPEPEDGGGEGGDGSGPSADGAGTKAGDGAGDGGGSDGTASDSTDGEAPGGDTDGESDGAPDPADGADEGEGSNGTDGSDGGDGAEADGAGPDSDAGGASGDAGDAAGAVDAAGDADSEVDAVEPPCVEGTYGCDGKQILLCQLEEWVPAALCPGAQVCHEGTCCVPSCQGKTCGDDGCGGSCGDCGGGACLDGACEGGCVPACEGKLCGPDGCGGDCGGCPDGFPCSEGVCSCAPKCQVATCGPDGCGGACGSCEEGQVCKDGTCFCAPQCSGKDCGPDGCGGECGACAEGACEDGVCHVSCDAGALSCKGDVVMACDEDLGYLVPLVDCTVAKWVCDGGICVEPTLPEPECTEPCTGASEAALLCSTEVCYPDHLLDAGVSSPTADDLAGAWEALAHYGDPSNDLAPASGPSYAVLSTGLVQGNGQTILPENGQLADPFAADALPIFDAVEHRVVLKVPPAAGGISVDLLVLTTEKPSEPDYPWNDKAYVLLSGELTTGGALTPIGYGPCADPETAFDLLLGGEPACLLAVNTAAFEICGGAGGEPDLSGTPFACPAGRSTGWIRVTWPVVPYDTITLAFHVHDTFDQNFDTMLVVDRFRWLEGPVSPSTSTP